MTDSANEPVDTALTGEIFTSPLREMAVEAHEIYRELKRAGFPEQTLAVIIAHIVADSVLYRADYDEDDADTENEDEDDTEGDDNNDGVQFD